MAVLGVFRGLWSAAVVMVFLSWGASGQSVARYADPDATGTGSGNSWANAFPSIQAAIDAMQPGDVLLSRGTFFEVADIRTENITWLGDTDPNKPTWIRGDRYPADPNDWKPTGTPGVYELGNIQSLINTDLKPGSVVYDYRRDDLTGTVTGIDLSDQMAELPANGAGVYFGHLLHADDALELATTPGSWLWDQAGDRVFVHVPEGVAFDPSLLGVCINGQNGVSLWKGGVRISGVNTLCTPGFASNKGYGLKGLGSFDGSTFENCDIIDSGWHAAGFEIGRPTNCTLRNIRAWSSGVDGSNGNIAFVFYSNADNDNAGHLGEDLTFHAYPLLGVDGAPIFNLFRPTLGISHTTALPQHDLGGILWQRCRFVDYQSRIEAKHGAIAYFGNSIVANNEPHFISSNFENYPVQVKDSVFEGSSAHPTPGIAYERCIFAPGSSSPPDSYRTQFSGSIFMRSCTIELGRARTGNKTTFFEMLDSARLYLEMCTLHADSIVPPKSFFRLDHGWVTARQCVFSTVQPTGLLAYDPQADPTRYAGRQDFESCYYAGPIDLGSGVDETTGLAWASAELDPTGVTGPTGDFIDPAGLNLRPVPGSELATMKARSPIDQLLGLTDIDGVPYSRSFGASQQPCVGDVNLDTYLLANDFTAWIVAFNAGDQAADINGNGSLEASDFSAWIVAFNAGCP
ncbi:MAG TPA: hypothetical protein ENJ00_00975 [Phycisphaerales bacterium]|nr:hypothetical protein [Phycisphaerales bacterium]